MKHQQINAFWPNQVSMALALRRGYKILVINTPELQLCGNSQVTKYKSHWTDVIQIR